jgi:carboxyl-terminal processing protease
MQPGKRLAKISTITVGVLAIGVAFVIGFYVGAGQPNSLLPSTAPATIQNPSGISGQYGQPSGVDFSLFWKAWQILQNTYVPTPQHPNVSDQDKVYGAIKGLAGSYGDPYTTFFPPADETSFQTEITGNFGGVGMEVGGEDGAIVIIAPLKGSPAEAAGIKAGDIILKINASSTADMSVDEAVNTIRGLVGTKVMLTVEGPGDKEPRTVSIIRQVITIPELNTQKLSGGIFDIQLFTFTADSATLFRNALEEFAKSGDDKLIIDLRGNPGGYLDAAVDMASFFLPSKDIVVTEDTGGHGQNEVYYSKGYDVFDPSRDPNFKMAVLVDGGSASASEILSAALEQNGVAKLVGTQTFGKGSVQELIQLTPATALKITVARWLTPNGQNISDQGLKPDIEVPLTSQNTANSVDPQLQAAENLLLGKTISATSTTATASGQN